MKTHKLTTTLAALATMTCVGSADAALLAGESFEVDFGSAQGTASSAEAMVDTFGAAATAVSGFTGVTVEADLGAGSIGFNDDPNPLEAGVLSAPFTDTEYNDFIGSYNNANGFTVTISGLDDALTYDIIGLSDAQFSGPDTFTVGAVTDTTTRDGTQFSLSGVSTDGSGNVVIVATAAGTNNPIINALQITAVPEPGSLALMGLGGLCILRRRRG